jgi:anti-anti-sigma regulatory factor
VDEQHGVVMTTAAAGGARLRLVGHLDHVGVDRLRALLDDLAEPGARVLLDLSRAGALPVAVLRALAATHRLLAVSRGGLQVLDPSPAAARSLRTSGLDRALRVEGWPARARTAGEAAVS